jgi:hypothetical protein
VRRSRRGKWLWRETGSVGDFEAPDRQVVKQKHLVFRPISRQIYRNNKEEF